MPLLYGILLIIACYAIGGIPTSLLVSRRHSVDLRKRGSGNLGATNVLRNIGTKAGLFVALVDISKGVLPLLLVRYLIPTEPWVLYIAGFVAVLGHIHSPYLPHLSGGKGVATAAGVVTVIYPQAALPALLLFILIVATTRIASLGSLTVFTLLPLYYLVRVYLGVDTFTWYLMGLLSLLWLLILYSHRKNIRRLLTGQEQRIDNRGAKGV